ncbi:MAG: serine/threonine-protein kinase [Gemmatimonadota bacterium]
MNEPEAQADWATLRTALDRHEIDLVGLIGEGATATVYEGRDRKHDRAVAIKVLRPSVAAELGPERFLSEISIAAKLQHPNILPLIDSGRTDDGLVYYTMPKSRGETLRTRLARGPLPMLEAVGYAREIAEALAHAHAAGFVHRDVKPENILLNEGHAMLADFGLARRIDGSSAGTPSSRDGIAAGTLAYASPEQLSADETADGRADLFSLGATLYEMLTGVVPFQGPTPVAQLAQRYAGPVKPSVRRPDLPAALDAIVTDALAPEPADRIASAENFVARLAAIQAPGRSRKGPRWTLVAALGLIAVTFATDRYVGSARAGLDAKRVAVADLDNQTGDSTLASLGPMASDWITAGLSEIGGLDVLNTDFVLGAERRGRGPSEAGTSPAQLRAFADSTKAGTVISGTYYRDGDRLEFFVEVTDARTGQLDHAIGPITGSRRKPDLALAVLRDSVAAAVRGTLRR